MNCFCAHNRDHNIKSTSKMSHYETHFSTQQIKACHDVIETFAKGEQRWCVLLAQMQSGKTDTFLLIACELLRQKCVDFIVIFSGTADTDLRRQLTYIIQDGDNDYWMKYETYLEDQNIVDNGRYISRDIRKACKDDRLYVVWGTQKSSYSGPMERTFFVWEESHYAQNINQGPAKFLNKLRISADGSCPFLEDKGNYVLSVSATPFSELSDNVHLIQRKKVIKMEPGEGYIGIARLLANRQVRKWVSIGEGLQDATALPRTTPKWAIIRALDEKHDMIETYMTFKGWHCVKYDASIPEGDHDKRKKLEGDIAWNEMTEGIAPKRDTLIIIKGKCRMGKQIKKNHILFVFETSKNPATDTILQSLLGRVCGYEQHNVIVYLSSKVFSDHSDNDLKRYVKMWENPNEVNVIPKKANNLDKRVKETKPIIPIVIRRDRRISHNGNNRKEILEDVYDALISHRERVLNKNSAKHFKEVVEKYRRLLLENNQQIHMRYLKQNNEKTRGPDKANALLKDYIEGTCSHLGAGCGNAADGDQVNIWVNKDIENHNKEIFYITSVVGLDGDERIEFNIPHTTKREVFAHSLEDDTDIMCNGGMPKMLSPETAYECRTMLDELMTFVEDSRDETYYRGIISLGTDERGEPKGILVTQSIFKELNEGGRIYRGVLGIGAKLKVTKSRGRTPFAIAGKDLVRLASITWEFY